MDSMMEKPLTELSEVIRAYVITSLTGCGCETLRDLELQFSHNSCAVPVDVIYFLFRDLLRAGYTKDDLKWIDKYTDIRIGE